MTSRAHVCNPQCFAGRHYPAGEDNPAGWDKLRGDIDALDDEELEICGLRRVVEPSPASLPTIDDHVVIPSDYPGEPSIHVMRHEDGDYGIAVVNGDRWPGKAATMCSSGGRNPAAWEAVAALWKAAKEPRT